MEKTKKISKAYSQPVYEYRNIRIVSRAGAPKASMAKWTYFLEGRTRYSKTLEGAKFDIDYALGF